jgi:hypothetical protein
MGYCHPKTDLAPYHGIPEFAEHLFGADQTAAFDILRGEEGAMKGDTVVRGEPVTGIERQDLDLRSLRQMRGLFHYNSTIVNPGLDRHAGRCHRTGRGVDGARREGERCCDWGKRPAGWGKAAGIGGNAASVGATVPPVGGFPACIGATASAVGGNAPANGGKAQRVGGNIQPIGGDVLIRCWR